MGVGLVPAHVPELVLHQEHSDGPAPVVHGFGQTPGDGGGRDFAYLGEPEGINGRIKIYIGKVKGRYISPKNQSS